MQKDKFSVMCAAFCGIHAGPHELDVSRHRQNGMHYMSRSSHQMQKYKFGVTSPNALFVKSEPVPPQHKK
jgi:hypothetical protein